MLSVINEAPHRQALWGKGAGADRDRSARYDLDAGVCRLAEPQRRRADGRRAGVTVDDDCLPGKDLLLKGDMQCNEPLAREADIAQIAVDDVGQQVQTLVVGVEHLDEPSPRRGLPILAEQNADDVEEHAELGRRRGVAEDVVVEIIDRMPRHLEGAGVPHRQGNKTVSRKTMHVPTV